MDSFLNSRDYFILKTTFIWNIFTREPRSAAESRNGFVVAVVVVVLLLVESLSKIGPAARG